MNKNKPLSIALLNTAAFVFMLVMNTLANALPLNGKQTGELSDNYPNLFVPAGLTFSIWGIIYLLLLFFIIYHFIALRRNDPATTQFIKKINVFFILSCLLNGFWIIAWHYEKIISSVVIMLLLLTCLLIIYRRLAIGTRIFTRGERYFVHLPFSIYLGWITVATIANITALLVYHGWNRWGLTEEFWTVLMMFTGTALAIIMALKQKDVYYGLIIMWALLGITIKRIEVSPPVTGVIISSVVFIAAIAIIIIIQVFRRKTY